MYSNFSTGLQTVIRSVTKYTRRTVAFTKLSIVSTLLVTASFIPLITFTGTAQADVSCSPDSVWVSGSSWLSGGGVNVCSAKTSTTDVCVPVSGAPSSSHCSAGYVWSGTEWQCVEFINRVYLTKGWTTATWYGNADTLVNSVPAGLTKQNDGSISYLNPGDVFTTTSSGDGHAFIINTVGSTIDLVSQNTDNQTDAHASAHIASGTSLSNGNADIDLTAWAGYEGQAVVHHPSSSSWGGVGSATYTGSDSMPSEGTTGTPMLTNYYLTSANVQYALVFQTDGNLVLYGGNGTVMWSSNTGGQGGTYLDMQSDGNLVMYKADHSTWLWQSNTGGHPGAYANLQSDGNFVVRDSGTAYWSTITGGHPNLSYYGSDRLTSSSSPLIEQYLNQNQYLRSSDNRHALLLQTDGNVVLYGPGYHVLWSTYTNSGDTFKMQSDGNLVLYAIGTAKWQSLTSGNPGAYYAIMQTDGNFVVYNSSNFPLWPSGTGGQI